MNLPSGHRQQKQKQKTLPIKKQENTLDFHSRLIEALVAASEAVSDLSSASPFDATTTKQRLERRTPGDTVTLVLP
jgi:hypothetical protein